MTTLKNIIDSLSINWLLDESRLEDLVTLFIDNSTENYISHGEIQEGRATSPRTWTKDLKSHLLNEFEEIFKNKPYEIGNFIGAFDNEKLIGFILVEYAPSPNGTYAILSDIIVDKKYRNQGIGEELVKWLKKCLFEEGIKYLYAESNLNNESAHLFLNKLGFKTISKVFLNDLNSSD